MVNFDQLKWLILTIAGSGALLTYDKDDRLVPITITADGDGVLVFLTYQ